MTSFEKYFVNREAKGLGNLERLERSLGNCDLTAIRDVLEIGCGIGTVCAKLSQTRGWNVTGTDYDPKQVALAQSTYPENERLRYVREDAARLSFADASFDLAISQNVFHHIPAWRDAAAELARVLRPGGLLVWYDIVAPAWLAGIFKPAGRVVSFYTHEQATRAFSHAGLALLNARRESHVVLNHDDLLYRKP